MQLASRRTSIEPVAFAVTETGTLLGALFLTVNSTVFVRQKPGPKYAVTRAV